MSAFVQLEAIAGPTGLLRYCIQPWQVSCVLIGAPPCFCLIVFIAKAKHHHACPVVVIAIPSQPSPSSCVTGMFTIISSLAIIEKVSPAKAEKLVRWFDPAILWIQRWLGAFYVPALAVLPLTIQGIEGASVHKAC